MMKGDWLLEFREGEVWAWACQELIFLRLGRCGLGAIFDLQSAQNVGEFRWQTRDYTLDFDRIEGAMWIELLENQLADNASDLSLARRFKRLDVKERDWQRVNFERGSRAEFEMAVGFMLRQCNSAQKLENLKIHFRIDDYDMLSWNCYLDSWITSGNAQWPALTQLISFFGPHRDISLEAKRRSRIGPAPLLFELNAPLKFGITVSAQPMTAHETLERLSGLRELFSQHLAPVQTAVLLAQISPASLTL